MKEEIKLLEQLLIDIKSNTGEDAWVCGGLPLSFFPFNKLRQRSSNDGDLYCRKASVLVEYLKTRDDLFVKEKEYETSNAATFYLKQRINALDSIQVIKKDYANLDHVIYSFDFTICQIAFKLNSKDKIEYYFSQAFIEDMNGLNLKLNPLYTEYNKVSFKRMCKYNKKGAYPDRQLRDILNETDSDDVYNSFLSTNYHFNLVDYVKINNFKKKNETKLKPLKANWKHMLDNKIESTVNYDVVYAVAPKLNSERFNQTLGFYIKNKLTGIYQISIFDDNNILVLPSGNI